MNAKCSWVKPGNYEIYHDLEHGKYVEETNLVFERLVLEIMQPGLSFELIISKRDALKQAFYNYDLKKISQHCKVDDLMNNPDIIRNRLKIMAVIKTAKVILKIEQYTSLIDFIIMNLNYELDYNLMIKEMVKLFKKIGFKFIGPSVMESFLSSLGFINAHQEHCQLYLKAGKFICPTKFGPLQVCYDNYLITSSVFVAENQKCSENLNSFEYVIRKKIDLYYEQKIERMNLPLKTAATEFQKLVYDVILNSKFGDYYTYKEVAHKINSRGYQAVGNALNKNKHQLLIACHRVGNKDKIGGFANRESLKRDLLNYENENNFQCLNCFQIIAKLM